MVDARLPDGSRVNATLPPVTLDGPTLSIRRFGRRRLRCADLMQLGMFMPDMLTFVQLAVRLRKNLLISGGTGAGKSTLLGTVADHSQHRTSGDHRGLGRIAARPGTRRTDGVPSAKR